MKSIEVIEQTLANCKQDVLKTIAGNKAAGNRLRKAMQAIKVAAQEVREEVLVLRGIS